MRPSEIWQWFVDSRGPLRRASPNAAAEEIEARFRSWDNRLGVEVCDDGEREVIVTAGGDSKVFDTVRELVASAPSIRGFRFTPLKPARGFDFVLTVGAVELDASRLFFEPLQSARRPAKLGIRIFASAAAVAVEDLQEAAWLLVETGIGEEAASLIAYLDVCPLPQEQSELLPITSLVGDYVSWHLKKRHR